MNKTIEDILNENTLYPDKQRKSREVRKKELLFWQEKFGEVNEYYNFYGLDCKDSLPVEDYLDREIFRKERYKVNSQYYPIGSELSYNYTVAMRDKGVFEFFISYVLNNDIKFYCPSLAIISSMGFLNKDEKSFTDFLKCHIGETLVFKSCFGFDANGVRIVKIIKEDEAEIHKKVVSWKELEKKFTNSKEKWLIQEYINQHPFMKTFNDSSVNIIRIISFCTGNDIILPNKFILQYGKKGNFASNQDGKYFEVEINEDGFVGEYAIDSESGKREKCPNYGKIIPFYKETKELVKKIHSYIPELFTIAWDIAITKNGPLIIEGNDGWDPRSVQMIYKNGMRPLWNKALEERNNFYKR